MRVLVHAFEREGRWVIQCLADDARTTVAPQSRVPSFETVLRLLRYVGATEEAMAEVDRDHRLWSIVSARIDLIPGRKNLLRVRAPWNEGLVDSYEPPTGTHNYYLRIVGGISDA